MLDTGCSTEPQFDPGVRSNSGGQALVTVLESELRAPGLPAAPMRATWTS